MGRPFAMCECERPAARVLAVRGLAARFDQMLVTNRVVRETLLQLCGTARHLAQELEHGTSAHQR